MIHRLEKAFGEHLRLEELAPFTHEVLLARDVLDPLAVIRVCCCPECHVVILTSQVDKRDPKSSLARALQLDREHGWVWLSRRAAATILTDAVAHDRTHAGFVGSHDEEKLERDGLE